MIQHPFSIVGITETEIIENLDCLTNIEIPDYDYLSQPTLSHASGV